LVRINALEINVLSIRFVSYQSNTFLHSDNLPNSRAERGSIARSFGALSQLPIITDGSHTHAFHKMSSSYSRESFNA
jgi:hypothetical protein